MEVTRVLGRGDTLRDTSPQAYSRKKEKEGRRVGGGQRRTESRRRRWGAPVERSSTRCSQQPATGMGKEQSTGSTAWGAVGGGWRVKAAPFSGCRRAEVGGSE